MMLELRDIYKTYLQGKLEVPVLGGISLTVDEGEYLAIMGPSGSGKTTLMNIIGCLDSATSGEYILEGEDIAAVSEKRMSEVRLHSIGFVFQSFYLLSRQSALDNVALPLLYAGVRKKERQQIARRALERVGLGDRIDFKPTQLSGGQCQRVAIARAIVNSPKILLADEPTGALDTRSGEQIMEIFKSLNAEGVTIVMITHEPEIAAHAKRVLHIRDGLLVGGSQQAAQNTVPAQAASPVHRSAVRPAAAAVTPAVSSIPAVLAAPVTPAAHTAHAAPAGHAGHSAIADPAPAPGQVTAPAAAKQNVIRVPKELKVPRPPRAAQHPAPAEPAAPAPVKAAEPPEEPVSGQDIIAALERRLEQLKDEPDQAGPTGGEGSNHEE